jgi:ethanolamine permease
MNTSKTNQLKKVLTPLHLWALGVGLVISGEYFGWNYGWNAAGTLGFLIATAIVAVLYITFIFSYTELTTAIPHAGGPFAFAYKAFGPNGGLVAGYASCVEFVLAPPAIALALGSYLHFLVPEVPVQNTAVACYVIFSLINFIGIKESAVFNLIVTLLAVGELLLFMGIVSPAFKMDNFTHNGMPFGWGGVFEAIPFAVWLFLGIEGLAMVAEEVKNPKQAIPKGYGFALATLILLALGVMILSGGIGDWTLLKAIDYPLPEAISQVLGRDNHWTKLFASIGLFGLIASFHSLITSYSRQLFALSRSGYLPEKLSELHPKFSTPHWALLVGGTLGLLALLTGTTAQVIIISALGAVTMYAISMLSLFRLHQQADYQPLYRAPFYPVFPLIALVLSLLCLVAISYYNPLMALLFFSGLLLTFLGFKWFGNLEKTSILTREEY